MQTASIHRNKVDGGLKASGSAERPVRPLSKMPATLGLLWLGAALLTAIELREGFSLVHGALLAVFTLLLAAALLGDRKVQSLLAERHRGLTRQTSMVNLLSCVAESCNQAPSTKDALAAAVAEVCSATGWPVGRAWFLTEDGHNLESSGVWHLSDPDRFGPFRTDSENRVIPVGIRLPGTVFATRRSQWIMDVLEQENFTRRDTAARGGLHAAFGFRSSSAPRQLVFWSSLPLTPPNPTSRCSM